MDSSSAKWPLAAVAPPQPQSPVSRAQQIDRLCDDFEAGLQGVERPHIEDYLNRAGDGERDELLRELLALEIEFRRRAGEQPEVEEYQRRFVNLQQVIQELLAGDDSTVMAAPPPPAAQQAPPSAAVLPADPWIGRQLAARYEVHRYLGAGGMGSVYQAKQQLLDRWVALKLIRPELASNSSVARRFHREMRATVRIQHPNTVRVYDYGKAETGELFLVMEYIDGRTLSAVLEDHQPLDPARVDRIGLQIAKALAAAHSDGIIHRDLKPMNVMLLDQYGERDFVKVLDFGLAAFTDRFTATDQHLSMSGGDMLIGTPQYMSPEQIAGGAVDHRSDLYALGVLLFRMVTGQDLFAGKTAATILSKHLQEPARRCSSAAGIAVPGWLDRLISQLLEKDPARRPQSAEDVVQFFDRSQQKVPVPALENERIASLRRLRILDTDPEQVFDDLTALASYICGTPIAMISLVDEDRQWFKSKVGISGGETSRNISFCAHTILGTDAFMVNDATLDARFADSPLVQNNPQVRFYAGMPLAMSDGQNVGALCVMDRKPRQLSSDQLSALAAVSRLVQVQLELRRDLLVLRDAAGLPSN